MSAPTTVLTQNLYAAGTQTSAAISWTPGAAAVDFEGLQSAGDQADPAKSISAVRIEAGYRDADGSLVWKGVASTGWQGDAVNPGTFGISWTPSAQGRPESVRLALDLPAPLSVGATGIVS